MNKVLRCPNCNEIIGNNLSRFCPSCGNALDAHQHHSIANKEMERVIDDVQDEINRLKKVKPKMVTNVLIEHLYVTLPILSVLICLVVYKFDFLGEGFFMLCLALGYLNFFLFVETEGKSFTLKDTFRKKKSYGHSYTDIKADVEKSIQKAKIKYGASKELSRLIDEFEKETQLLEQKNRKTKAIELIIYGVVMLSLIGVFLIPTEPRVNEDEQAVQINTELELIEDEINRSIQDGDYGNALDWANQLHHPLHVIYSGKGGFFETVYYDEYWNSKREKYKQQILEQQLPKKDVTKKQMRTKNTTSNTNRVDDEIINEESLSEIHPEWYSGTENTTIE